MSGYPAGGGHHDYNNEGYANTNTDSYYQDDQNGQYYDDGYGAQGGHQGNANDGYYDESGYYNADPNNPYHQDGGYYEGNDQYQGGDYYDDGQGGYYDQGYNNQARGEEDSETFSDFTMRSDMARATDMDYYGRGDERYNSYGEGQMGARGFRPPSSQISYGGNRSSGASTPNYGMDYGNALPNAQRSREPYPSWTSDAQIPLEGGG